MQPNASALKALIEAPGVTTMPGCADGMGARLIAEAGFRTGFVSGSTVSALRLARPDMDLISFLEMADAVGMCTAAAPEVLWLADGDTGHGNELNVQRTIAASARAGAAAILIEDKVFPHPLGVDGRKLVVDRAAARRRMLAAVEACRREGILLLARTDAIHSLGIAEALARIAEFAEAGADILFLDSPQSAAELAASVEAAAGKPAIAVTAPGARHAMPGDAELEAIGIRLNIHPQDMLAASLYAMRLALGGLKGGAKPPMGGPGDLASAIRLPEYLAEDARWSPQR